MKLGVLEIFFGTPWPFQDRLTWAPFLRGHGMDFFIYGPKADAYLRKKWREEWDSQYRDSIRQMVTAFHKQRIKFGVAFSPFGLGTSLQPSDKAELIKKAQLLQDLGVDIFGVFFDDMPVNDRLAATQIEVMNALTQVWSGHIAFCPSYYCDDPILDKVFGPRPPNYIEDIAAGLPSRVEIFWTGPKVISPEIPGEHLRNVSWFLKRKPFICDNFYANDGPKNCKFLKLKAPTGRNTDSFNESSLWSFNPMNQAHLSKVVVLAGALALQKGLAPEIAFDKALTSLCSNPLAQFLRENAGQFLSDGLDKIPPEEKQKLIFTAMEFRDEPIAGEIVRFLRGEFTVGSECLTD